MSIYLNTKELSFKPDRSKDRGVSLREATEAEKTDLMHTKKQQPKNAPAKRNKYAFSVKAREGDRVSFYELMSSKISNFLGGTLLFLGFLSLLFGGVYAMLIWWRVIAQFEFWKFMGSVILFPITIPLTPIYLGVKGNWEPTGVFMFAMILGFLLLVIGNKLYKLDLTN